MNYCTECLGYDYCSARGTCINPPFGYCTRYQPKRMSLYPSMSAGYRVKMDESKGETKERREDAKTG